MRVLPSWPNPLLKAPPPNTSPKGLKFQHNELDKGHKHSDHSSVVSKPKEEEKWKVFRPIMIRERGLESTTIS